MVDVPFHYGRRQISLRIPQTNIAGMIAPRHLEASSSSSAHIVGRALHRVGVEFSDCVQGKVLGVLLPDGTRDLPLNVILPQLLPMCRTVTRLLFFICTGTHNAETPENHAIIKRIQAETANVGIGHVEIIVHDCQNSPFVSAGSTDRGTEVQYNGRLREVDCFLAVSDVKHHYFAGYSNPIKNLVPGLCAFETTQHNHSWTMDPRSGAGVHPWHLNPALRDNPLACDQLEAMETIVSGRAFYSLVTLSSSGIIQWADIGPAQMVTAQAFEQADAWNSFIVEPVRKMIVSAGGFPNDVDLYIAQRALELTHDVVCDGGEILFLSACPNGAGSERTRQQFYEKLIGPLDQIAASDQKDYRLFSHKPYRFARLIKRLGKLWLYSDMDPVVIEKMHMNPCADPQAIIDGWLGRNPQEKIMVIDGANKVLLRKGDVRR